MYLPQHVQAAESILSCPHSAFSEPVSQNSTLGDRQILATWEENLVVFASQFQIRQDVEITQLATAGQNGKKARERRSIYGWVVCNSLSVIYESTSLLNYVMHRASAQALFSLRGKHPNQ